MDNLKNLIENKSYDELKSSIYNKKIDLEFIKYIFKNRYYDLIEILYQNKIITFDYLSKLILINNNISNAYCMLKSLSEKDIIIENINSILKKGFKNIHHYNLMMNIMRTIISEIDMTYQLKLKLVDIYLEYSDIENLIDLAKKLGFMNKFENLEKEENEELFGIMVKIADSLINKPLVYYINREDINYFISLYGSFQQRKMCNKKIL